MKAFVTGGAGFIGSHIVDHLIAQGAGVTVYDNLTTGFESQSRRPSRQSGISIYSRRHS